MHKHTIIRSESTAADDCISRGKAELEKAGTAVRMNSKIYNLDSQREVRLQFD